MVPYHLIDIADAGYKYNVYEYQNDFFNVFKNLQKKDIVPVMCGGSGMYIEAVLGGFQLVHVPSNPELRAELEDKSLSQLTDILASFKKLHNTTEVDTKKRAIRAVEIETYYQDNPEITVELPELRPLIVGVDVNRDIRRERITQRLKQRIDEGMITEVQQILKDGVPAEDLIYYGLEYKYLTQHVIGELSFDEMFDRLNIAIHQFAKRQMTWFRKMERSGYDINWIDGTLPIKERLEKVISLYKS